MAKLAAISCIAGGVPVRMGHPAVALDALRPDPGNSASVGLVHLALWAHLPASWCSL